MFLMGYEQYWTQGHKNVEYGFGGYGLKISEENELNHPNVLKKQMRTSPRYHWKILVLLCYVGTSIFLLVFLSQVFRTVNNQWSQPSPVQNKRLDLYNPAQRVMPSKVISTPAALDLPKKGSVFCFVLTSSKNHHTRVQAVASTWLPRCDHGEFFSDSFPEEKNSTKLDDNFQPSSDVPLSNVFAMIPDKYDLLFEKTLAALEFAYIRYPDFDWYYKADDDTFVVMENLRSLLDQYNSSKPYYIGYRMKPYMEHGYNAGGAGYVLSSAALKLFNEKLLRNRVLCPFDLNEDVGIGRCFESLGIFPIDTRNSKGQQRFNTYNTVDIYHRRIAEEWHFDKQLPGSKAMAADLISLHHLTTDEILIYDHLIYKVARQLTMNDRKKRKRNPTP